MNMLWIMDKELDGKLSVSARLATLRYLVKNHSVTILTTFHSEKMDYGLDCKIIYLDTANIPFIKILSLYVGHLKFLRRNAELDKYDVIFINSHNPFLGKKLVKLRDKYKLKVVADIRSLPVDANFLKNQLSWYLFGRSVKYAAKNFDGMTYITDYMRSFCQKKLKLPQHQYAVWSSGVDTDLFKPQNTGRMGNVFRLIYHGEIAENRGIYNAVKALDGLRDKAIELVLLGSSRDVDKLKNLINNLKLDIKVRLYDPVPQGEVPRFINNADAGILPFPYWQAWNTSSPLKLFEYLSCGKPVIVTRIPAHTDVLKENEFAFWAESSSPEDLKTAILSAYAARKSFVHMSRNIRSFTIEKYSWKKQLHKLESFLKGI